MQTLENLSMADLQQLLKAAKAAVEKKSEEAIAQEAVHLDELRQELTNRLAAVRDANAQLAAVDAEMKALKAQKDQLEETRAVHQKAWMSALKSKRELGIKPPQDLRVRINSEGNPAPLVYTGPKPGADE